METATKVSAIVGALIGSVCSWFVVFDYLLPWLEVTSNAKLVGFLIWVVLGWGTGATIGYFAGLIVTLIILFAGAFVIDIVNLLFNVLSRRRDRKGDDDRDKLSITPR